MTVLMTFQLATLLLTFLTAFSCSEGRALTLLTPARRFIRSSSLELPLYFIPDLPADVFAPQQIHLALGTQPNSLSVTWSTANETSASSVRLSLAGGESRVYTGAAERFRDGGELAYTQLIHRVLLTGLKPGANYSYSAGSPQGWSQWLSFTGPKVSDPKSAVRVALFGDMGVENAQSLPRLLDDANKGLYDAILHVGDFAYDMPDDNGHKGDKFMQMLQPIAAHLPYMVTVGNHEYKYNFSHYKMRFTMPLAPGAEPRGMFYSYRLGAATVISISTEFYFYVEYGITQIIRQFHWLENELKLANQRRDVYPWLIVLGHRPIYCSNNDSADCGLPADWLRNGIPPFKTYGLEPLLNRYGVDLAVWAHEHSYERTWPVFDMHVKNGSRARPYTDPKATVHIVTGSAGCRERHDSFGPGKVFTAKQVNDYGYTRLQIANGTHLFLEQVSDDKQGAIVDTMTLVQHNHGPFHARNPHFYLRFN